MKSFISSLVPFLHRECTININHHHFHSYGCGFVITQSVRFQTGGYWCFLSWSILVFSREETWTSKWSYQLSQPLPGSNARFLPPSTLPAFLCSWSYLFLSQLRVLLNLCFFWLPDLVLRHSTPCPTHDKNAWECSASHVPPQWNTQFLMLLDKQHFRGLSPWPWHPH